MPAWLVPIIIRALSTAITTDNVKGAEKELLDIVEKALEGHPLGQQIVTLVAQALGLAA